MASTTRSEVFSSVRAAQLAAQRDTAALAMELPQISRLATSAAVKVKDFAGKLSRTAWQVEAYNHANEIPELGYVLGVMAATAAKGCFVVVEEDESGNRVEPELDANNKPILTAERVKAQRVLRALKGPDGDHKAAIAMTVFHDQIAGEGLLLGEPVPETSGLSWEMLSVLEIVQDPNNPLVKIRQRSAEKQSAMAIEGQPDINTVLEPDAHYLSRYHRRDLAHSGDATSTLRRNASVCREIVLLDQLKELMIKSRLAAGLLLVPEEVSFPADDDTIEDVSDADRFLSTLIDHITAPISDRRSASSLAPLVVQVPADLIEKWKLLSLSDGVLDLDSIRVARNDALHRLAGGIDLPMERMQGMGSTNHWNAALLDSDEVRKHIIPMCERIARFFTVNYLRRMLIEFEEMDEALAERFSFEYDASEILARLDAAAAADALHADGLISDDARIRAHGFDPDEVRPTDEERMRRLAEKMAAVPHQSNRPLLAGIAGFREALVEAGMPADLLDEFLALPPIPEPAPPQVDEDEPEPADDLSPEVPSTDPDEAAELAVMERIRAVAASALDNALVLAANRVATNSRKLSDQTKAKVDRPDYRPRSRKPELLRHMAPADWARIKLSPEKLIGEAWDDVSRQSVAWLKDMYTARGLDRLSADEQARRAASEICHSLDELALSGFEQPLSLEDGLSVPLDLVRVAVFGAPVR